MIAERQDLVIIDRMEEKMDVFEFTVSLEINIQNANTQKMNKYEHFITDITARDVSVHHFEIGLRGYISPKQCEKIYQVLQCCHHTTFLENEKH